ncbi:DUF4270 family protein [Fluviicola sp.]|uniref:DUF4270 family protein n=1 Tax=Fluviicola sp. TaxID=1917219 RepID=UPI0031D18AE2
MMNLKKLHNNWRKGILLSACFVLTLSVLPGCKKTSSPFGSEALSVEDLLAAGGKDTFQLNTYSVPFDTLATDNQNFGTLGAYHDPKFGIVNASIYTQLTVSGAVTVGTNPIIDSIVLSLNYGGYYGTLDPQTFEVYQLADELDVDSVYKRSTVKSTMGSNLVDPSSATQTPNTSAKVILTGDTTQLNPQLRLRLNNAFGQQFLDDMAAGNSAFTSSSNFLSSNYLKGLKISVSNTNPAKGKGAVLYFKLDNSQTKMTIYYKLGSESVQKQVALVITGACADFNHVDIDNSGYHIADVLANPINGKTQFYSQSFNVIPKIEMPTISKLSNKTLLNNALLSLPIAYHSGDVYYPTQTFGLAYSEDGGKTYNVIATANYDNNQKGFLFDIRHYVQEVISGKKQNSGLYVIPAQNYFRCTADRVVFNGSASPYKTKPKLVLKYTEFK